jgi:hypothetical protein
LLTLPKPEEQPKTLEGATPKPARGGKKNYMQAEATPKASGGENSGRGEHLRTTVGTGPEPS